MIKNQTNAQVQFSRLLPFLAVVGCLVCGLAPVPTRAQSTAGLKLSIANQFGKDPLKLEVPYVTLHGDSLELTRFVYYLSNIELTDKNGKVIARFSPKTLPDSPEVIAAIEKALK